MKTNLLLFILFLAAVNLNTTAQNAGDNDPTFNPSDVGFGFGEGPNNDVYTSAVQADGKIIIGGFFTAFNGTSRNYIARLNTDGSLDTSFNIGVGTNNVVLAIAIQTDGRIIICGGFTSYNGIPIKHIARLNTDGSLDTSFVVGSGASNIVHTTTIQTDGKIIIGGEFWNYNGIPRSRVARLNTDGSLDTSFVIGSLNNYVYATAIQTDGKIIIGGDFSNYNVTPRRNIARLNTDGSLDTSFVVGTGVSGSSSKIKTTVVQSDGKIIIGGNFNTYNGTTIKNIARLNNDGSLDTSFLVGSGTNNDVNTVAIQTDGKIIIGGEFGSYKGASRNCIVRLDSNGGIDYSFVIGIGASNYINTIAIQTDGKVIIGGEFGSYNRVLKAYVARIHGDGRLDYSFIIGTGPDGSIATTAIQSDGKIIIGGAFSSYFGIPRSRIARINPDGSLDTSFVVGTGFNGSVTTSAIQADRRIIIGGSFTSYNGNTNYRVARLNIDGSLDSSFLFGVNNDVYTTAIQSDGKIIVGGNFTIYNGPAVNRITRIHTNGSIDTTFNVGSGANHFVSTTAIQSDGKIIIGGMFTSFNGTPINRIARLNTDGSLDTSFNVGSGANNWVKTVAIQADGKIIVGGNFTDYNGTSKNRIVRLNADGSLDASFLTGTGVNHTLSTIAIQNDGKIIIGGWFSQYNGVQRGHVARLNINGSLDASFIVAPATTTSTAVGSTAIQNDGKIIIGGTFKQYNGVGRNRIARILQCTTSPSIDSHTVCDSITWIDGHTYTSSTNTPVYHVFNTAGCVSVVTLNLTTNATSSTDVYTVCDSVTWIDGNTYTSSTNTPTFTLTNANGCDSIVTLNLTINSNSTTDVITTCDSVTWIDGITYTSSTNTPTVTLTNTYGCDSVVTLNLTVSSPTTSTDLVTACNSFTWIDSVTYTSSTNIPTVTLISAAGCDSVVTLNLTVNHVDITITQNSNTLTVGEAGAAYQWLDCNNGNSIITGEINQSYNPVTSGDYAVAVTKSGCTDTSVCVNFIPNTIGINELENSFVKIYPNPTSSAFIIELVNSFQDTQLSIVSIEGKTVYSKPTINTNKLLIDASEWSKGIYVVKITDKQSSKVMKLIKQ